MPNTLRLQSISRKRCIMKKQSRAHFARIHRVERLTPRCVTATTISGAPACSKKVSKGAERKMLLGDMQQGNLQVKWQG